jgi:hypothetical protein
MKRISLLALSAVLLVCCKAQETKTVKQVDSKKYAKTITSQELKDYLYEFSSDEFEGRETGEPGQKKAAKFLKEHYQEMNIKSPLGGDDYFQEIPSSFYNDRFGDSENVLAFIEGSEFPDQIVVLSAHYDHLGIGDNGKIYNGADDDGSGTVAILEMAQAFKQAVDDGYRPRRSILFLHVTGEEKGLLGSKYYTENPVFPLENTVTDLNTDMIGRVDEKHKGSPNYIYLIGSDRLSTELDSAVNMVNDQYTNLDFDYTFNAKDDPNNFYQRSDHYNFAKHDIPVIFFFSGVHEDYHKPTDTAEKIKYDLMTKRAKLIFHTAWEVANRDKRLEVDKAN